MSILGSPVGAFTESLRCFTSLTGSFSVWAWQSPGQVRGGERDLLLAKLCRRLAAAAGRGGVAGLLARFWPRPSQDQDMGVSSLPSPSADGAPRIGAVPPESFEGHS